MTPRDPLTINDIVVEWIDSDEQLADLLATRDVTVDYALDTEFIAGQAYFTELSLVQIAWPDRIALIDPYLGSLQPLRPFFEGPADAILHAMEKAISDHQVTYDLARLMPGAQQVSCSGFGQALIARL